MKKKKLSAKILFTDWSVVQDCDTLPDNVAGEAVFERAEIRIRRGISKSILPQVLMHEIVHAIYDQIGIRRHNETEINSIAGGVCQVLRENKWIRRIVCDEL